MNQEKIGKFIKDLREERGLTQKEFADSLGVTFQAVSKWENGKNIPDIGLLKSISEKYNVDINEILDGQKEKKKKNYFPLIVILILILGGVVFYVIKNRDSFEFRNVTSTCDDYKLTGIVAFNAQKSSFYITNIEYCGEKNEEVYSKISCTLYEKYKDTTKEISSSPIENDMTIEEFIKTVELKVDNYQAACGEFTNVELILEINASTASGMDYTHKIPLSVKDEC